MEEFDIYKDIADRTGGDIYLGVVGPVRTGKSTFIKRFMDLLVLPNIENVHTKERAKDELPQSASGKTIMTTEPKFVPNEAVKITLGDNTNLKVRMIDCVGYLVPGAEGNMEGDGPRMIHTPWSPEAMPFQEAAEMGTSKVIKDHSTIGIVVTTDGSITEIPRENYLAAESQVVKELKEINKPFVMLLNSTHPYAQETEALRQELSEAYQVPVMAVNCAQLKGDDIINILETVLYEFPMKEVQLYFPTWLETLDADHWLKQEVVAALKALLPKLNKLREVKECIASLEDNEHIRKVYINEILPGEGSVSVDVGTDEGLFYQILSETTDMPIENDYQLINTIQKLAEAKKEYDKIAVALGDVQRKGYGIVTPAPEEIRLEEPELFKQGSRYGIRLKAKGETIHLIKADIETDVSPIVGTEEQSKDFIADILRDYKDDPEKVWDLNIFGRTLSTLVNEGMNNKVYRMPEDAQMKLQETLQKIINEGSGGLICIIL